MPKIDDDIETVLASCAAGHTFHERWAARRALHDMHINVATHSHAKVAIYSRSYAQGAKSINISSNEQIFAISLGFNQSKADVY